jgi:hypothetical protein
MEPVSIIATALALGASAGLKHVAEAGVKDAYAALKSLIGSRYSKVSVEQLEASPGSAARRSVVEEDLKNSNADRDLEVLESARKLLDAVQRHAPQAAAVVGVEIDDVRAASIDLEDIISSGKGVRVSKADIGGDIKIKKVRAGEGPDPKA